MRSKKSRKQRSHRQRLIDRLDKWFSLFIRRKDADSNGYVSCFTCGRRAHYKRMQAGHFQSRVKMATRWEERNVKPQCPRCNMYNGGQQFEFGQRLNRLYGEGTADEILIDSNRLEKYTDGQLMAMIEYYQGQAEIHEHRTG